MKIKLTQAVLALSVVLAFLTTCAASIAQEKNRYDLDTGTEFLRAYYDYNAMTKHNRQLTAIEIDRVVVMTATVKTIVRVNESLLGFLRARKEAVPSSLACPPANLTVSAALNIIARHIEEKPQFQDLALSLLAQHALSTAYPCANI